MTNDVTLRDKVAFVQHCKEDPVFFVENVMMNEKGKPYVLEDFQKEFLRCKDSYRMLFLARRLSKTTMMRMDILHKSMFIPSFKTLVVLPSHTQAKEFGREIQDVVNRSELLTEFFPTLNITNMTLNNNSRIDCVTAGGEGVSQLGKGARYLAFDEAQQIPDSVYGFILPILRGQEGKKWQVFSGTPLGKIGMFWEVYNDAKLLIKDGIKIPAEEEDVEIDGEQFVVFQRQTAYLDEAGEIIRSGTRRVSIPELKTDRKRMGEIDFLREYCLEWMDSIGEVFPQELIESCLNKNGKQLQFKNFSDKECVAGVDFGKQRNNSVVTVGERGKDGKINIIFIHTFPLGTQYDQVVDYILTDIPRKFPNIRRIAVDQTGVGEAVVEQIQKTINRMDGIQFKVIGFNFAGHEKKKALVEAGVYDMEKGKVHMLYHNSLYSEMLTYRREITDSNNIRYTKSRGGTDDHVDSFLLCLYANRETIGSLTGFNVVSTGANLFDKLYVPGAMQSRKQNIISKLTPPGPGNLLWRRGIKR